MRLLVIGAPGQIGQEFVHSLPPELCIALGHDDIEVADAGSVRQALQSRTGSFDAVINLAAFHDLPSCEDDPEKAFRINAVGALNVANCAGEFRKTVCFFSTGLVFGDRFARFPTAFNESALPQPLNVYGVSKAAGEAATRAYCSDHLIVRTGCVFGTTTSRKGRTFPETILQKARAGEKLRVVTDRVMSPTYAKDLAEVVIGLLERGVRGTIHVVNNGTCSWYNLAVATLKLAGEDTGAVQPVKAAEFGAKTDARRPAYWALVSTRRDVPKLRHWREALAAYLEERGELA